MDLEDLESRVRGREIRMSVSASVIVMLAFYIGLELKSGPH